LGSSYVGSWANDQPQGLGEMTYSSGMKYNGNWENGMVCVIKKIDVIVIISFNIIYYRDNIMVF